MQTTVIYHKADADGWFCREIARKFLPDAELIGWDFGDAPVPVPKIGLVYVLDLPVDQVFGFKFGMKPEDMISVLRIFGDEHAIKEFDSRLIWIDHHKSSIESHPKELEGYRIDGVAACRLAWQWFLADRRLRAQSTFPEKHEAWMAKYPWPLKKDFVERAVCEPLSVRLAGEYDIWDKRDPNAELFQHGLRSIPLTDGIWEELLQPKNIPNLVQQLLHNGQSIQYAKSQENESIITSCGFTIQFEGFCLLACNAARYNSQLFKAGLKPEHDGCIGFNWDGKQWRVSLYHAPGKEHHDLSVIAKKYGGGGHSGACGMILKTLPFEL